MNAYSRPNTRRVRSVQDGRGAHPAGNHHRPVAAAGGAGCACAGAGSSERQRCPARGRPGCVWRRIGSGRRCVCAIAGSCGSRAYRHGRGDLCAGGQYARTARHGRVHRSTCARGHAARLLPRLCPLLPTAAPAPATALAATVAPTPPAAAPAAVATPGLTASVVIVGTAQLAASGQAALSGSAPAGARIEIVEDGVVVGNATAGPDGRWSFSYTPKPGNHVVAAQRAGDSSSRGPAVQLNVPAATPAAAPSAAATPVALTPPPSAAATPAAATPVPPAAPTAAPGGQVYIVKSGDWLSRIAQQFYGNPGSFPLIVNATNARAAGDSTFARIGNANVIRPGQKLWIPAR